MRKIRLLFLVMLFSVLLSSIQLSFGDILKESNIKQKNKIISVVYDDSTSMIRDDEKNENGEQMYTCRWIEAYYAAKALAAMMNKDDKLRFYKFSDSEKQNGTVKESKDSENLFKIIKNKIVGMTYADETSAKGLLQAEKDFEETEKKKYDCWIVIITDGKMTENGYKEADELTDKLIKILENGISVAYIPIGRREVILQEASRGEKKLIVAEGGQEEDVTIKITNIINKIYDRIRLDVEHQENYITPGDNDISVNLKIPVKSMIVFLQYSGEEKLLHDKDTQDTDIQNTGNKVKLKDTKYWKTDGDDKVLSDDCGEPKFKPEDEKKYDKSQIKYRDLWGAVFNLKPEGVKDTSDQTATFLNTAGKQLVTTVYYQPMIDIEVEYYTSADQKLVHNEEYNLQPEENKEELCIEEGEMGVGLQLKSSDDSFQLESAPSELIGPDKFKIYLFPEESDENKIELENVSGEGKYRYSCEVGKGRYTMKVYTPWETEFSRKLKIQEKGKELGIQKFQPEKINVDHLMDEEYMLKFEVTEDGAVPENPGEIEVNCESTSGEFDVEEKSSEAGKYIFQLRLKNPADMKLNDTASFALTASRTYETGKIKKVKIDKEVSVTSDQGELKVICDTSNPINAFKAQYIGARVPLMYFCNGEEIKDENLELLNCELASDSSQIPVSLQGVNLHFGKTSKWWGMEQKEIPVTIRANYNRYARKTSEELSEFTLLIPVEPIPPWVKTMSCVALVTFLIWLVLCIAKCFTPWHVKKMEAYLVSDMLTRPYRLDLHRKRNILDPFCRKAAFVRRSEGRSEGRTGEIMPGIEIYFYNKLGGDGFVISNYLDFSDAEIYQIGGQPISDKNKICTPALHFMVKDTTGRWFELRI